MNLVRAQTFRPSQKCLPSSDGRDSGAGSLAYSTVLSHSYTRIFLHSEKGELYKLSFDITGY